MALIRNKELKTFYSIKEVAEMFNVAETLLRFWEKSFPTISPQKTGRGIRQYTKDDIEKIRVVYHLVKEQGMTLQGAREAIKHTKGSTKNVKMEVLDRLSHISNELQSISKELSALE